MLPIKIINRLHLGRPVAAFASALHDDCLAWVLVEPVLHPEKAIVEQRDHGFEALVQPRIIGENPIAHYILRYIEIPRQSYQRYTEYPWDWDYHLVIASYRQMVAHHEQAIADTLAHWQIDSEALHIPGDVGFPLIGYDDTPLEEQSLTRQLITVLRTFPEHTIFSFHMTHPIMIIRSHGDAYPSSSTIISRKRYSGRITDIGHATLTFTPHQKLKLPSRDTFDVMNIIRHLDQTSLRASDGVDWVPIRISLNPLLSDLTQLDCYNPITYQWSSYKELLVHTKKLD